MAGTEEAGIDGQGGKGYLNNELDLEWVELFAQAREHGLSVDEIRDFLQKTGQHEKELALVSK